MSHSLRIGYLVPRFPAHTHLRFWREMESLSWLGHDVIPLSLSLPFTEPEAQDWTLEALARTEVPGTFAAGQMLGGLTRLVPRGLPLWLLRGGPSMARAVLPAMGPAQALLSAAFDLRLDHLHVVAGGRAAMAAALARRMGGAPYSVALGSLPRPAGRAALRLRLSGARFVRVPGERMRDRLADRLGDGLVDGRLSGPDGPALPRMLVSRIGVDPESFCRNAPYTPPAPGRPARLLSVGVLRESGGQSDLLAAMRHLLDQGVDVRLTVAGQDQRGGKAHRATLEAELRRLHLQDHVRLVGPLTLRALREALTDAHLFVEPRRDGAPGAAVLEAMAMRVPVLATGTQDRPAVIRDGRSGLLTDAGAPAALARAIRDVVNDPERLARYADAGAERALTRFSVAAGAAALAKAISESQDAAAGVEPDTHGASPQDSASSAEPAQATDRTGTA